MAQQPFSTAAHDDLDTLLDHIQAYFQPVSSMDEAAPYNYEALGRVVTGGEAKTVWPYLESINSQGKRPILELNTLRDSCRFLQQALADENGAHKIGFVSVNLHHQTLSDPDLMAKIDAIFTTYPEAQNHIKFELLEDVFPPEDCAAITANIEKLATKGFPIYLDDLGEDLSFDRKRLQRWGYTVAGIKFGAPLWDMDDELRRDAVITMLGMTRAHDVVFENVETEDHVRFIREFQNDHRHLNCFAQGWHPSLGKDLSPAAALASLTGSSQEGRDIAP